MFDQMGVIEAPAGAADPDEESRWPPLTRERTTWDKKDGVVVIYTEPGRAARGPRRRLSRLAMWSMIRN